MQNPGKFKSISHVTRRISLILLSTFQLFKGKCVILGPFLLNSVLWEHDFLWENVFSCTDSAVPVWTPAAVPIQGQLCLTHESQIFHHTHGAVDFIVKIGDDDIDPKNFLSVSYSHRCKLIEKEGNPLFWCNIQGTKSLKSICIFPQDMFWHSSFPGCCQHDTCTMIGKMLSIPLLQKSQLTYLKHEET